MNVFENNNHIVVKDHNGKEYLLSEGVDINVQISKTDDNDPSRQPTVIAVKTDNAAEAAKIVNAQGIDELEGLNGLGIDMPTAGMDGALELPRKEMNGEIVDNNLPTELPMADRGTDIRFNESEINRIRKLAGLKETSYKFEKAEDEPAGPEDTAGDEEMDESVESALEEAYASFDGIELDESAIEKVRSRVNLRKARAQGDHNDRISKRVEARPGAVDKVAERSRQRKVGDGVPTDQEMGDDVALDAEVDMDQESGVSSPMTYAPGPEGPEPHMGTVDQLDASAFDSGVNHNKKLDSGEKIRQMVMQNLSFLKELRQEGDGYFQMAKEIILKELEDGNAGEMEFSLDEEDGDSYGEFGGDWRNVPVGAEISLYFSDGDAIGGKKVGEWSFLEDDGDMPIDISKHVNDIISIIDNTEGGAIDEDDEYPSKFHKREAELTSQIRSMPDGNQFEVKLESGDVVPATKIDNRNVEIILDGKPMNMIVPTHVPWFEEIYDNNENTFEEVEEDEIEENEIEDDQLEESDAGLDSILARIEALKAKLG